MTTMTVPRIVVLFCILVAILCAGVYFALRSDATPIEASVTVADALSSGSSDTAALIGYRRAVEPREFIFPADHGPHNGYKTEWWYFTGNLHSASGREFGYQLTFFRSALKPPQDSSFTATTRINTWSSEHLFMAHFALTDVQNGQFYSFERFNREAQGLAGAWLDTTSAQGLKVWVGDWSATAARGAFPITLHAKNDSVEISLMLDSLKTPSLQGKKGFSQKGEGRGNASYYYSMMRLATQGLVRCAGESLSVSGTSWMDREWSTSALGKEQVGWDWFALHLNDNTELMYYQLRKRDGSADTTSAGSVTLADCSVQAFRRDNVQLEVLNTWTSPRSGVCYPAKWRLRLPREGLDLVLTPVLAQQELNVTVRYWEGAVRVEGNKRGRALQGRGYVELTGYGGRTAH